MNPELESSSQELWSLDPCYCGSFDGDEYCSFFAKIILISSFEYTLKSYELKANTLKKKKQKHTHYGADQYIPLICFTSSLTTAANYEQSVKIPCILTKWRILTK